jgi:hypothetical protein
MSETVDRTTFEAFVETLKTQRNVALDAVVSLTAELKQLRLQRQTDKEIYEQKIFTLTEDLRLCKQQIGQYASSVKEALSMSS